MKYWTLLCILVLSYSAAAQTDEAILKNLDMLVEPPQDMVSSINLITYKDQTPVSSKGYTFFLDKETRQFLLICVSPSGEQGVAYIKRKKQLWNFAPTAGVFLSAQEYDFVYDTVIRIEDLLPRFYSKHYKVRSKGKTDLYQKPAIKLFLRGKSESAPYDRITLWLDEESMLILKEEAYDGDSNLLKSIRFSGYRKKNGWYQPSRILITDALHDRMTTLITIDQTTLSPVPEYVFTRSFVEFITQ